MRNTQGSTKLVAYLRVSTDRQAEEGLGLDVQRAAIDKWASENRHRITAWKSDEGVSGSDGLEARIGLADALAAVRSRTVHGLVVYRLDRLARDLVLQESLLADVWRHGGRVYSTSRAEDALLDPAGAESDPSRDLVRRILGAVADYERSMIRLRMRAGNARKAELGGFVGGQVPFGFRAVGRELVPDDAELETRARIVDLRSQSMSLRRICAALAAEGRPAKRSDRWYPDTVAAVLRTWTA